MGISENDMAVKTKNFANQLRDLVDLPLYFYDETLSSQATHRKIAKSHMKKSKRRQPIDHFAASQFLQEWLDMKT